MIWTFSKAIFFIRFRKMDANFDPSEWAEKRKLAMVKASELREQRRAKAAAAAAEKPRVVRADSRDSVSTQGGGEKEKQANGWKWDIQNSHSIGGPLENVRRKKPQLSSRVRAVTSPPEKRRIPSKSASSQNSRTTFVSMRSSRPIQIKAVAIDSSRPASAHVKSTSSSSDPVTRQMIDRDTLRLENRALFIKAIHYWRSKHPGWEEASNSSSRVSVYVRKRPLFDKEAMAKEFDTVSVTGPNAIVTHNCLFQADLKTPYLSHSKFVFNKCFDENASNQFVFQVSAKPLVELAKQGGLATIFCFGQTGSGKTHTMTAIEELASSLLFEDNSEESIKIEFIELCGKKVFDLLPCGAGEKNCVKLREAADGSLALEGATQLTSSNASELTGIMEAAHKRRNTESTGANEVSSRSHAVCILTTKSTGGKLLLVDLAGSERRKDSMWHDKDRQREGAEINASIHALKECIRMQKSSKLSNVVIPFRLSTLTRILAETFTNVSAQLAVIATVSPCATDVEHTVSTLKTVHQLAIDPAPISEIKQTDMYPKESGSERRIHPKKWNSEQVSQWLETMGEAGGLIGIPKSTTGAMLVRMPESRFLQACNGDEKRASKIYRSLHVLMQQQLSSK